MRLSTEARPARPSLAPLEPRTEPRFAVPEGFGEGFKREAPEAPSLERDAGDAAAGWRSGLRPAAERDETDPAAERDEAFAAGLGARRDAPACRAAACGLTEAFCLPAARVRAAAEGELAWARGRATPPLPPAPMRGAEAPRAKPPPVEPDRFETGCFDAREAGREEGAGAFARAFDEPAVEARRKVGFDALEAEELDFRLELNAIRLLNLSAHRSNHVKDVRRRGRALVHNKVSVNGRHFRAAHAKTLQSTILDQLARASIGRIAEHRAA